MTAQPTAVRRAAEDHRARALGLLFPSRQRPADALLGPVELGLRERLREVLVSEVAPRAAGWDLTGDFAGVSYQYLAAAGLGGVFFDRDLGGLDAGTLAYALAVEEVAAVCPATSLIYMTQVHAAYPIVLAGTREQVEQHVPRLLSGEVYGCLAVTEPGAGSDVAGLTTAARRTADGYAITGSKTFITTGDRAGTLVVFATTDRSAGRRGITAFVVPGDAPGLTRGAPLRKLGMHGSSTAELFLDATPVGQEARLGDEGGAWSLSMQAVTKSRISAAAQGVGIARAVVARTAAWLEAVGGLAEPTLGRLSGMARDTQAARALLYTTARAVDGPHPPTAADVAVMKATCTDTGVRVATEAFALLGPYADQASVGVEQLLRDVRVTQIYDGTNEVQDLIIARELATELRDAP